MGVPARSWTLLYQVYRKVIPVVREELGKWRTFAEGIPDPELRSQALMSIDDKAFHCKGGAVYGLLAGKDRAEAIRFIVAYQTICDYLDNLCDRSTSLDADDFRALHESLADALTPGATVRDYYRFRKEKEDGGYLASLVRVCQEAARTFPAYEVVKAANVELASLYGDLQVYKHVELSERVPLLEAWFEKHQGKLPEMSWYEFSACAGSTLGIFCLTSYAAGNSELSRAEADQIKDGYYPWVQGLHIMLDYYIDQEEDEREGDLNFCSYYESESEMLDRLGEFYRQAGKGIEGLPDERFHRFIRKGLIAIYLSDDKVKKDRIFRQKSRQILKKGGAEGLFFYMNNWMYRQGKATRD
ncbi:tetraprenyl-beta-curcumene synthase family protein [Alteribacter natronophilus]|uniref:tetraprenyl-beta-curcumene synthase family protein n=1 Tax=Alteribacter natronophilus TaxID=2583810 RepID=UPI00110DA713|nr:tetraprenyl-beta-curcumene synthase family protein [Alteribacter natronophilus]TMW71376.1 tetraprenyl-beta-curcumene synthase family protein [Alteribacter natronophilus]